jgi:hypothetical protein
MLQQGEKLKMALELDVKFYDKDEMAYNTVAEIPGTDPALKDEVVMLGATWIRGTAARERRTMRPAYRSAWRRFAFSRRWT